MAFFLYISFFLLTFARNLENYGKLIKQEIIKAMGIMYYNPNPVPVEYTEEEMREKVLSYIDNIASEFSFKMLSNHIISSAIQDQKVKNASQTQYGSREMDPESSILLSKILWELIWSKKIFIIFGENPYSAHYTGDTRFVAIKLMD